LLVVVSEKLVFEKVGCENVVEVMLSVCVSQSSGVLKGKPQLNEEFLKTFTEFVHNRKQETFLS
jgi:hypothetical protein